jgi:hypothetical protein
MAPMSQRKGMKIPMIPKATYPFLKVSKHTVKRQTMYAVKRRVANIQSSMVMWHTPNFRCMNGVLSPDNLRNSAALE